MEQFEYDELVANLKHTPVDTSKDSRKLVMGALWNQYFSTRPPQTHIDNYGAGAYPITDVSRHFPWGLRQRQATLMATVFTWFGSNVGESFIEEAFRLRERLSGTMLNFMTLAWANENQRLVFMNHGQRTLECLVSQFPEGENEATQKDYEIIEQMMAWLGHGEGLAFLEEAWTAVQSAKALKIDFSKPYELEGYKGVIGHLRGQVL